ncbi:MAG: hypothetical protein ACFE9S_03295 [Candidatus Hermodarchaeota archaeon]
MREIKKFIWLIPLIGGVLSLFGLLIPTWYSPPVWVEYWWFIGLIHHVTGGDTIAFGPLETSIPSLIAFVLIALSSVIIILNSLFKSREKTLWCKTEKLWIYMAILEIITAIFYIISVQIGFFINTSIVFWDLYLIQFGLIIPFIGAGLTLLGAILEIKLKRDTK